MHTESRPAPRFAGWLMLPEPLSVEAVARAGFDWIGIDLQHGSFDLGSAFRTIQLLDLLGMPALVRLSQDELPAIARLCDHGASGVIVAMVEGPDVVARAVADARYQPEGRRSYGAQRCGLRAEPRDVASVRPAVYAMIEDRRGLEHVEEIASVPGLAGLHIGPVDLGLGLGLGLVRGDPAWRRAVERIRDVAHSVHLPVAIHAVSGRDGASWAADGFDDVVIASDITLLRGAMARELAAAHGEDATHVAALGLYGGSR